MRALAALPASSPVDSVLQTLPWRDSLQRQRSPAGIAEANARRRQGGSVVILHVWTKRAGTRMSKIHSSSTRPDQPRRRASRAVSPEKSNNALLREAFAAAQQMPRLRHRRIGRAFDARRSRVLVWLAHSPAIRAWLFEVFRQSRVIVFDQSTREWRGKEVSP